MAISTTRTEAETGRRAFVTLRFASDDLDPGEISAVLPVEPTRAHRKGEEFFAGPHAGKLRGRTGIWFLATDKLVSSDRLDDHFAFVERLLYPEESRIKELRKILKRTRSHAHVTCFWRGERGERVPEVPVSLKSAIKSLNAEIETNFVA